MKSIDVVQEILNILKNQSKRQDLKDMDSLVVFILSHGDEKGVCGLDDDIVKYNDICSVFDGKNCPILKEKPKMFFIQACQGGMYLDKFCVQIHL